LAMDLRPRRERVRGLPRHRILGLCLQREHGWILGRVRVGDHRWRPPGLVRCDRNRQRERLGPRRNGIHFLSFSRRPASSAPTPNQPSMFLRRRFAGHFVTSSSFSFLLARRSSLAVAFAASVLLAASSCSSGIPDGTGNDIRGTAHMQQGFDPGVELRGAQAIGGSDAVGTILPRGPRGGNIAVVFYAFDTTRSAGEFPQVASKSAGALPAENSARDVLVAAVTKLSIFLDE